MKILFVITAMILAAGCSTSQPTHNSSESGYESDVSGDKAAPAPGTPSTTLFAEPISGASPTPSVTPSSMGRSCKTPIGVIADGGSATGYMTATVPDDQVCVSDTIKCKDGLWTGKAIHPNCKIVRPKAKK